MAVAIVATVGSASANSFATLAEADTYAEARLNTTLWDAATDDSCNRALVEATRELNYLRWQGRRADDTQALAWPRDWARNPDDPNYDFYDTDEIPQRVKDATCELALQFIKNGTTDIAALPGDAEVISKTVDVISKTFASPGQRRQGLRRFPSVWRYIAPLLEETNSSALRVVRG